MRIGLVCPYSFDEPGGVQAHILDLAKMLIAAGDQVEVIGPARETTDLPSFVHKGGNPIEIRYNGSVAPILFGPRVHRRIKEFIAQGDFDVLHIHEPNSPSFSMHALLVAQGPIVATYHASVNKSILLDVARPFLEPLLEKISAGIAVSEMARRWQVEKLGGDPVLIPNGVDTAAFIAARQPSKEPLEIVFMGRLDEPRKGLDILLEALEIVRRNSSRGFRVTIIGPGTQREVEGVDYVGRVTDEEKAQILGRADIYVAPNTGGESFGIVLVEAMAAGTAVIASDLEAFAAVCQADSERPAGLLFRNGSAEDLARQLIRLLGDSELRKELVEAGELRAQDFDWVTVAQQIKAVYETITNGRKVTLTKNA